MEGFKSFDERLKEERANRALVNSVKLSYGMTFLDEALRAIRKNSLILLGAKTGVGKTQLATRIAQANIKNGKRVHYFALEAEKDELEQRIKYQAIAERFFYIKPRPAVNLNFLDWSFSKFDTDPVISKIETDVEKELSFPSFFTFYRTSKAFGGNEFNVMAEKIHKDTDLIIIDHLHYFDFNDKDENKAIKATVKLIRDVVLIRGVPVVLLAHMRKTERTSDQIVPGIEDFHGSSDIGKIATVAITLAKSNKELTSGTKTPTFISIQKCRMDGSLSNIGAKCIFDAATGCYENDYSLVRFNHSLNETYPIKDVPHWAVNHRPDSYDNTMDNLCKQKKPR